MANKKNKQSNYKSSNKKWSAFWIGAIAFIVIAVTLIGLTGWRTSGFKDWTYGFGSPAVSLPDDSQDKPDDGNTDDKPSDEDNKGNVAAGGLSLMTARIAVEDYPIYDIPEGVKSADEISIITTPEKGKFDWAILHLDWENPDSEWASGKDVISFVQLYCTNGLCGNDVGLGYPLSEKVFLIGFEKFAEPIILTCTMTVNGQDYVKTCRVECMSAPEKILGYDVATGTQENFTLDSIKGKTMTMDYQWGTGTVKPDTVNGSLELTLDYGMVGWLQDIVGGYTFANNGMITYSGNQLLDDNFTFGLELEKLLVGEYDETQFWNDFYSYIEQTGESDSYPIMTLTSSLEYYSNGVSICTVYTNTEVRVNSYDDVVTWVTDFELSEDVIILM